MGGIGRAGAPEGWSGAAGVGFGDAEVCFIGLRDLAGPDFEGFCRFALAFLDLGEFLASKTRAAALRAWRAAFFACFNTLRAALNFSLAARARLRATSVFISAATARAMSVRASTPVLALSLPDFKVFIKCLIGRVLQRHRLQKT